MWCTGYDLQQAIGRIFKWTQPSQGITMALYKMKTVSHRKLFAKIC